MINKNYLRVNKQEQNINNYYIINFDNIINLYLQIIIQLKLFYQLKLLNFLSTLIKYKNNNIYNDISILTSIIYNQVLYAKRPIS